MLLKCSIKPYLKRSHVSRLKDTLLLNVIFDILHAIILERGVEVTPSESNTKGMIKPVYDLKDL